MIPQDPTSYDGIVHIIQLSLSPIFLLSAVAALLGTFTTRLARISDKVNAILDAPDADEARRRELSLRLSYLRRRTQVLDLAVILAAVSGACTCGTVLALFFSIVRDKTAATLLFVLFGSGILCTLGALAAFLAEVLLASRGIRAIALNSGRMVD